VFVSLAIDNEEQPSRRSELDGDEFLFELNVVLGTLEVSRNGRQIGTVQGVRGDVFYPFIVFHTDAPFPMEIKYLEGNTGF